MKELKIKVCGMKDSLNIAEVAGLMPDYMGFILYEQSPRYVSPEKAEALANGVPASIRRTGVLVNMPFEDASKIAHSGIFDILQLHGNESPDYCKRLSRNIEIIKAFRISDRLPENLKDYQPYCRMFLFDTAGKDFGGTGKKFDHSILASYALNTEYILGGGISADDSGYLKSFRNDKMAGVDLNSRFEISPGIKNVSLLKEFIEKLRNEENG